MAEGWIEIRVTVPRAFADAVANRLIEFGSPGLRWDDHADQVELAAYFTAEPPLAELQEFCAAIGCPLPLPRRIPTRRVAAENWAENWKLDLMPQPIGARLYVCPSWQSTPPPGRLPIVIDPGMAFGTGHHATTRGCLILLERFVGTPPVGRAVDVGTGSGVLAIALAKLGVPEVWAVDTDASACAIARDNAQHNAVASAVRIASNLSDAPGTFPLVVANLFASLLHSLEPTFARVVSPAGILICSGFLDTNEAGLLGAYARLGFLPVDRVDDPPWPTIALQRRSA